MIEENQGSPIKTEKENRIVVSYRKFADLINSQRIKIRTSSVIKQQWLNVSDRIDIRLRKEVFTGFPQGTDYTHTVKYRYNDTDCTEINTRLVKDQYDAIHDEFFKDIKTVNKMRLYIEIENDNGNVAVNPNYDFVADLYELDGEIKQVMIEAEKSRLSLPDFVFPDWLKGGNE